MDAHDASDPLDGCEAALEADAWPARARAVQRLHDTLRTLPKPPTVLRLAVLLERASKDRKWEVRQACAEALDLLPEPYCERLADALKGDANHDVSTTAERVVKRRTRATRTAERQQGEPRRAAARLKRIASRLGEEAAAEAEAIGASLCAAATGPVTHDLRTVLVVEQGAIRQLREAMAAGPHVALRLVRQDLVERERRAVFVAGLVDDMDDFLHPSAVTCDRVALEPLVRDALDLVRKKLQAAGATRLVRQEIVVERGLTVLAPRRRLLRALMNLIKNAFEAIERTGTLRITAEAAARRRKAVLKIADTGCGIAAQDQEQVFLPGVTTKKAQGRFEHSGWGLAIARRFVERDCSGKIELESQVGEGTTLTVTLPTVRDQEEETT